jgi:tRNA(Ile)-lysidine synthase
MALTDLAPGAEPINMSGMSLLRDQFLENVRARRLFEPGQPLLAAVSGGPDSMVLLHLLHEVGSARKRWLTAAHFNHGLRGRSSAADERLVRSYARKLGIPLIVESADVAGFAEQNGISLEMAGRHLRHEFFARTSRRLSIKVVALAHHADDQLELFFLRLLRGAGGQGLAGMSWKAPSPADRRLILVRPLLDQTKEALESFAKRSAIPFRLDASNQDLDIPRNRIRSELLPLLQRGYQPALRRVIGRVMDLVGAESEAVNAWSKLFLQRGAATAAHPGIAPILAEFSALPTAVQRRCLQLRLQESGIEADFDLIEKLRGAPGEPVCAPRSQRLPPPPGECRPTAAGRPGEAGNVFVSHDGKGNLRLVERQAPGFRDQCLNVELRGRSGGFQLEKVTFAWQIVSTLEPGPLSGGPGGEVFDADAVGDKIVVRHWRPGDRFQPIGMRSAMKLQDFFVNQKIPRARRHELLVASTGAGQVFWVEGMRISELFKLRDCTIRGLLWNCQRLYFQRLRLWARGVNFGRTELKCQTTTNTATTTRTQSEAASSGSRPGRG